MPGLGEITFALIFLSFLVPVLNQRMLQARRYRAIRQLEQKRPRA